MKITKDRVRELIREVLQEEGLSVLSEEPADYYKDYKKGTISYAEYKQLVSDFNKRSSGQMSQSTSTARDQSSQRTSYTPPEKKWTGSPKELEKRVHQYLIDVGFYREAGTSGYVNPFSSGGHPSGGYTSNIPKVIKNAIADGDIDWATWPEIEPTYRKIDRSID